MNVKEAYKDWSNQYDTNENKTRDLEGVALRSVLSNIDFNTVLEFGCGTGKNTVWLKDIGKQILAADFSEAMISKAVEKIKSPNVEFKIADINQSWDFTNEKFDLVTFSLVLEHIENLDAVFEKINKVTNSKAFVYIGELHPFKQYAGSKARFMTDQGEQVVTCYTHHISELIAVAKKYDFKLYFLEEWFDDNDKTQIPRILTLLFQKK
jgi:ubiquinone/menaquinone biosynthesis C-methylase UbiE